jgi:transketolase
VIKIAIVILSEMEEHQNLGRVVNALHTAREFKEAGDEVQAANSGHPGTPMALAPSTKTRLTFESAGDFTAESYNGRNFHFGIREHAVGAILNGLSLSKIRPFGSGFLIFSDYGRPAIRLSALMELPVIHIFTHDSIGVGEDGPTHQPVEQLASLRAIPGLIDLRPADANEVTEARRVSSCSYATNPWPSSSAAKIYLPLNVTYMVPPPV